MDAASSLTRHRLRLEARLRRLGDYLDTHQDDEDAWARYERTFAVLVASLGPTGAPMVTTQQLAERFGVSADTVREWVKQGRLEPAAKFGRRGGFRFRADQSRPAGDPA